MAFVARELLTLEIDKNLRFETQLPFHSRYIYIYIFFSFVRSISDSIDSCSKRIFFSDFCISFFFVNSISTLDYRVNQARWHKTERYIFLSHSILMDERKWNELARKLNENEWHRLSFSNLLSSLFVLLKGKKEEEKYLFWIKFKQ